MDSRIWKIGVIVFIVFAFILLTASSPYPSVSLTAVSERTSSITQTPEQTRNSVNPPNVSVSSTYASIVPILPTDLAAASSISIPNEVISNVREQETGTQGIPNAAEYRSLSSATSTSQNAESRTQESQIQSVIPRQNDEFAIRSLGNGLFQDRHGIYRSERALVTAYCPCERCCGNWAYNGKTSTGKSAWTDGVAADPMMLPYGTKVFIPGYGIAEIDDTGGAMRRSRRRGVLHLDVRMAYHYEARRWGSQTLFVRIYQ